MIANYISKNFLLVISFLLLAMLAFIVTYFLSYNKDVNLLKDKEVVIGKYLSCAPVIKGDGIWINYEFSNKQRIFKNQRVRLFIESSNRHKVDSSLKNFVLYVVYEKKDPENNIPLLSESEFKKYDVVVSDSARTTLAYLQNLKF